VTDTPPETDIAELFARDPLELSTIDIGRLVDKLREMRGQYALGNAMAGSTKPKTEKQKATLDLASKLDLTDILGNL
jgi:hypothetical protein